MYLDTDVILAALKEDDWLASEVDIERFDTPMTSVATAIEVQYVKEGDWDRDRLTHTHEAIQDAGIKLVDLTAPDMAAAGRIRARYPQVNVFDSVHLGSAVTRDLPIVSTDTLYPDIDEIDHVDPRSIG